MEQRVVIDKEKCIGCGLCKSDCVAFAIDVKDGKAVHREKGCIMCGHCEAICPVGAVKLTGYDDEVIEIDEPVRLNPEELMMAIKTRRSIRKFKQDPIDEKILDMILEAGRLTPTGSNKEGVSYVLLRDRLSECEEVAVSMFRGVSGFGKAFVSMLKEMDIDDHFFFKNAPAAIVILGDDKVSASLAAENMALMAEANGLGVLYSGFFTACYNMSGKIRTIIGSDKNPKAVTTIVLGYPDVKYRRTVHRKPLNVIKA
ncbi:MAG: nitroreductase family protein [Clostridia bacterium]|nr:nitroreductase family protein [Clostridia bacterium]